MTEQSQIPGAPATRPPSSTEKLRQAILAGADFVAETIVLPAPWDVTVEVRSLDATARAALLGKMAEASEIDVTNPNASMADANFGGLLASYYPELVAAACYNPENGEKLFDQPGDVERLGTRNGELVAMLGDAAARVNGMIPDAATDAIGGDALDTAGKGSGTSTAPAGAGSPAG